MNPAAAAGGADMGRASCVSTVITDFYINPNCNFLVNGHVTFAGGALRFVLGDEF